MATWQAIVDGTTYSLSDGNPFKVLSISGIGNAPVRRLEERGPFQDGSTDIGYRLDARLINIAIQITGASLSATDGHRDTLGNIFNPRSGRTIYLRCTRDDGQIRQIDCYVTGMLDMPAELGQRDMAAQRVGVQLKAPNPIWYNPTQATITISPTVAGPIVNWQTASGVIGTGDVFTYGTAVAPGSAIPAGTIAAGDDYSILMRTNGTSSAGDYLLALSPDAQSITADNDTGLTDYVFDGNTYYTQTAGTQTYILVRNDTNVVMYENGSAILTKANGGTCGIYSSGADSRWGSHPGGSIAKWNSNFSHVAIYRKALSTTERSALGSAIVGTAFTGLGTVSNNGSWNEYPVIVINGAATNTVITNMTTGETLDFTGATIPANTSYIIDTRYGYKTIIDSNAVNQIAKLSNDSDLATFHLAPGANIISSAATTAGTVTITAYDRYLGL